MKHLLFLILTFFTVSAFAQTTATITLQGRVKSKAADVTSIASKWTVQSGSATIANPNQLVTTAVVPVGVTVFALTGTDNFGSVSAPAYRKVTVYRDNVPPVMDAGSDTTIQLGSSAFVPNVKGSFFLNDLVYRVYSAGDKIVSPTTSLPTDVGTYKQGNLIIKIEDIK